MRGFRDLRVWQGGMELVESVYRVTQSFPKQEIYGLTSQLRRAAVSIPANIAEGQSREHIKEYLNFLSIAQGSVAELETELEIAGRLGYIAPDALGSLMARPIRALRAALANRTTTKDDDNQSNPRTRRRYGEIRAGFDSTRSFARVPIVRATDLKPLSQLPEAAATLNSLGVPFTQQPVTRTRTRHPAPITRL